MSDYISRQAAIIQLSHNKSRGDDEWMLAVESDIGVISSIPAADAVPVVRCKYCRYRVDPDKCCHPDGLLRSKDSDFCSYGERREE